MVAVEDNNVQVNRCSKRILHACDKFVSLFVVAPLVVTHWYGTWDFMDRNADYFPNIESLIMGFLWHLIATITRKDIHDRIKSKSETKTLFCQVSRYMFVKIYLYFFSVSCIMQWRALFNLMMIYFGK